MRPLTPSEVRVISLLLASDIGESERSRVQRSESPRSTYQDVRRRAYHEKWLRDRFLLTPGLFGFRAGAVLQVRPFAEGVGALASRWRAERNLVLSWASPQWFFGFLIARDESDVRSVVQRLTPSDLVRDLAEVPVSLQTSASLPVYFDFEAAWNRFAGLQGASGYPRPLIPVEDAHYDQSPSLPAIARKLLLRALNEGSGRPSHRLGPFGIPKSQRRLLERGWVTHRVLLDPRMLPPYAGNRMDLVLSVSGRLSGGRSIRELQLHLAKVGASPFLLAEGGGRVLLLLLGQRQAGTVAPPAGPVAFQGSVMGALGPHLSEVQVVREDWDGLEVLVDHDFARLLE